MRGGSDEKLSASPPPGDKTRLWNEFSHPASPSGDSDSEAWVVAERENREARYDGAVLSPIGRKRAKEMSRKKFAEVHATIRAQKKTAVEVHELPVTRRPPTAATAMLDASGRCLAPVAGSPSARRMRASATSRPSARELTKRHAAQVLERERASYYTFASRFAGPDPDTRERRADHIVQRKNIPEWLRTRPKYNAQGTTIAMLILKCPYHLLKPFEQIRMRGWIRENVGLAMLLPRGAWCMAQDRFVDDLANRLSTRTLCAEEVLYFQGSRPPQSSAPELYFVVSGWLDVIVDSHVVRKLHVGDLVGHADSTLFADYLAAAHAAKRGDAPLSNIPAVRKKVLRTRRASVRNAKLTVAHIQSKLKRLQTATRRSSDSVSSIIPLPVGGRGGGLPRSTTVQASEDCTLLVIAPAMLRSISNSHMMQFDRLITNFLKNVPLFDAFSERGRLTLAGHSTEETVPAGTKLFEEGQDAKFLIILRSGEVTLTHPVKGPLVPPQNTTCAWTTTARSAHLTRPGQAFGTEASMCFFNDRNSFVKYLSTATAKVETTVLRIGTDVVSGSMSVYPPAALAALRMAFLEMRDARKAAIARAVVRMTGKKGADRKAEKLRGPSYQKRLDVIDRQNKAAANRKRELALKKVRAEQRAAAERAAKYLKSQQEQVAATTAAVAEVEPSKEQARGERKSSVHALSDNERQMKFARRLAAQKLADAVKAHDVAAVRDAIDHAPACVNSSDANGATAMIHACWDAPLEIIELLVANGADVNAHTTKGYTALHFAYERGRKPLASLLQRSGALRHRNIHSQTAQDVASPEFLTTRDVGRVHDRVLTTFTEFEICGYISSVNRRAKRCDTAVVRTVRSAAEMYDYEYDITLVRTGDDVTVTWQELVKRVPNASRSVSRPNSDTIYRLYVELKRVRCEDLTPPILLHGCLAAGIYVDTAEATEILHELQLIGFNFYFAKLRSIIFGVLAPRLSRLRRIMDASPRSKFLSAPAAERRVRRASAPIGDELWCYVRHRERGVPGSPWREYTDASEAVLHAQWLKRLTAEIPAVAAAAAAATAADAEANSANAAAAAALAAMPVVKKPRRKIGRRRSRVNRSQVVYSVAAFDAEAEKRRKLPAVAEAEKPPARKVKKKKEEEEVPVARTYVRLVKRPQRRRASFGSILAVAHKHCKSGAGEHDDSLTDILRRLRRAGQDVGQIEDVHTRALLLKEQAIASTKGDRDASTKVLLSPSPTGALMRRRSVREILSDPAYAPEEGASLKDQSRQKRAMSVVRGVVRMESALDPHQRRVNADQRKLTRQNSLLPLVASVRVKPTRGGTADEREGRTTALGVVQEMELSQQPGLSPSLTLPAVAFLRSPGGELAAGKSPGSRSPLGARSLVDRAGAVVDLSLPSSVRSTPRTPRTPTPRGASLPSVGVVTPLKG